MTRIIGLVVAIVATLALTSPPATSLPDWTTSPTTSVGPSAAHPRIVNLRYAQHRHFDRVVIRIEGRIPGYRATYRRHFSYDASGLPVPIRGGLQVVLTPAYAHNGAGDNIYRGPTLTRPGLPRSRRSR